MRIPWFRQPSVQVVEYPFGKMLHICGKITPEKVAEICRMCIAGYDVDCGLPSKHEGPHETRSKMEAK